MADDRKNSARRNFRRPKVVIQNSAEILKIDLTQDAVYILQSIASSLLELKDKTPPKTLVTYFNILVTISSRLISETKSNECYSRLVFYIIRIGLWNDYKEVRCSALRCLRFYIHTKRDVSLFIELKIDYLIARCIDLSFEDSTTVPFRQLSDTERVHALRLLSHLCHLTPRLITRALVQPLVSVCLAAAKDSSLLRDQAVRGCLLILTQLFVLNPGLVHACCGMRALLAALLSSDRQSVLHSARISEAILLTLLSALNTADTRAYLPFGNIEKLMTPFSTMSYNQVPLKSKDRPNFSDEQSQYFDSSVNSLLQVFRSWPGLLYFCQPNSEGIRSLTSVLSLGHTESRRQLLNFLYDLFLIPKPKVDSPDFQESLLEYVPRFQQHEWSLAQGFVAEEGLTLIPYSSHTKLNIIDNHLALLLSLFVDCGLFEGLSEAVGDSNESVAVKAGILLGQLTHLASVLFPSEHPLSLKTNIAELLKSVKSQRALHWLERVYKLKEQPPRPFSPFLLYLNSQVNELASQEDRRPPPLPKSMDLIFDQVVGESEVVSTSHSGKGLNPELQPNKWDWELLVCFTRKLVRLKAPVSWDEPGRIKLLRRLMAFFSPKKYMAQTLFVNICQMTHDWPHARKVGIVATDLLYHLSFYPEGSEQLSMLRDLLTKFRDCIQVILPSNQPTNGKSPLPVGHLQVDTATSASINTMTSTPSFTLPISTGPSEPTFSVYQLEQSCAPLLFLAVCRLTVTDRGEELLESSGVTEALKVLLDFSSESCYAKLVISSVDYTRPRDSLGRVLLASVVSSVSEEARLYAARFLRLLLRVNIPFFPHFCMDLLIKQLHDQSLQAHREALDALQEACESDANLNTLNAQSLVIVHLGYPGHVIFARLLAVQSIFNQLKDNDSVSYLLDQWRDNFNLEYSRRLEEVIFETLTSYERPAEAGAEDLGRYSSHSRAINRELILPSHPYGSLAQHRDGMDILLGRGDLQLVLEVVQNPSSSAAAEPGLKAALWAVSHVATSSWGINWAVRHDLVASIRALAETSESLTVRGTAFWCMGLVGSTPPGADLLKKEGWLAVRSNRLNKWPLLLDNYDLSGSQKETSHQWGFAAFGPSSSDGQSCSDTTSHKNSVSSESTIGSRKNTLEAGSPNGNDSESWLDRFRNNESGVKKWAIPNRSVSVKANHNNTISSSLLASPPSSWQQNQQTASHRRDSLVTSSHDVLGYATLNRIRTRQSMDTMPGFPQGGRSESFEDTLVAITETSGAQPRSSLDNNSWQDRPGMLPVCFVEEYRGLALPQNIFLLGAGIYPSKDTADSSTESHDRTFRNGCSNEGEWQDCHQKEDCFIEHKPEEEEPEIDPESASLRRDFIEAVSNLMAAVQQRANESAILNLKARNPSLVNDPCLYAEVASLLATYHFAREARTFIQELFLDARIEEFFVSAEKTLNNLVK